MGYFTTRYNVWQEWEFDALSSALGVSLSDAFGCMMMVWSWVDEHVGVREVPSHWPTHHSPQWWDQWVGKPGFMTACLEQLPKWFTLSSDGRVIVLNCDRYMGAGAKGRQQAAKRQKKKRVVDKENLPIEPHVPSPVRPSESTANGRTRPTWLTPYFEAWKAQHGPDADFQPEVGKAVPHLYPLNEKHGARCVGQFKQYIAQTEVAYLNWGKFAAGFGTWNGSGKAEPTRYVPSELPQWMQEAKKGEKE